MNLCVGLKRNAVIFTVKRLQLAELGNLGDYKSLGNEIYEMRIHYGAGYRLYFGIDNGKIIVLTNGGDKSTQHKDILHAKQIWQEYKEQAK
ncbi:MAG: type II toxin-antitoxin system RelE/ParE family toxin [Cardiobacteriaceae bacterium]|nr:type II toxin-antitoxin system RelE/ParE family toxin [Cardiobacteriaceae bacterium]